jgi:hypothetical protein
MQLQAWVNGVAEGRGSAACPGHACRYDDIQRVSLQTRAVICACLVNCLRSADRLSVVVVPYVRSESRVVSVACNIHANALLLCCIAQRPDIEAETRVVVIGQDDAEELILCYICVSHQHM